MATGSRIARAGAARLAAVQAVYQTILTDAAPEEVMAEHLTYHVSMTVDGQELLPPDAQLFTKLVRGVADNKDMLKEMIDGALPKKSANEGYDGLDHLLKAILLCGTFELYGNHDVDGPIILSDYLHVTRAFYETGEHKLINGVLDTLLKRIRS